MFSTRIHPSLCQLSSGKLVVSDLLVICQTIDIFGRGRVWKLTRETFMTSRLSSFVLFLIFVVTLPLAQAEDRPVVTLGATLPLTGDISFFGTGIKNSLSMALEDAGNTKYRYKLLLEDDQGMASKAVAAFYKLTEVDKTNVVISTTSPMALALAPLVRRKGVLHLGLASDSSYADGKFNFNVWPAPGIPAGKLVQQFQKRNIKRVALMGLEHAWPRADFAAIVNLAKVAGIEVVLHEYFTPGETNFRPLLGRFRNSGADIGVLVSFSPEIDVFTRQYRELQINIPLTSEWAFEASKEPNLYEGFWFVNLDSAGDDYREKYKKRFGFVPYAQMELGDIFVKLIVKAFEGAGDGKSIPTTQSVAAELLKIQNEPSVLGSIGINSYGVLVAPYVVKIMKDGQAKKIPE